MNKEKKLTINTSNSSLDYCDNDTLISELISVVDQKNCLYDPADKILYGYDHSGLSSLADIVVLPRTTAQVQAIIQIANKYNKTVIARGQATNTCGATIPQHGGIIIATQQLNNILEINPKNRYATVQPGVINAELQDALKKHKMFWPPDPSSSQICTIGGNLACNSAGPSAVKYGVTRDHVLGLTFVTGYGDIIKTGVYTTKGVVGYDLTRLLIGSEGTLGIITEATLKLSPLPEVTHTLRATFDSIETATETICKLMQQETTPSALEILDANCLKLIKNDAELIIPDNSQAMLIIEANGNHSDINNISSCLFNIIKSQAGCLEVLKATNEQERQKLWQARKSLSPRLRHMAPQKINEDVAVPISNLPKLLSSVNSIASKYNIMVVNFGHAGNGNIHVNLLIDKNNLSQKQSAEHCLDEIFNTVLELKGTVSGEHGVGITKAELAKRELGDNVLKLNKKIKEVFDPNKILNPNI